MVAKLSFHEQEEEKPGMSHRKPRFFNIRIYLILTKSFSSYPLKFFVMKATKRIKRTGLFFAILVFCSFIVSCQDKSKKTGEKLLEDAIENETGSKADVDLNDEKTVITTGGTTVEIDDKANAWPREIPSEVPEFTYGKVRAVTTSNIDGTISWNVSYENVEDDFIDKYDADLKKKGFETVTMKMGNKGGSITADNGKYNIFLMGSEGSLSIGVSPKQQE